MSEAIVFTPEVLAAALAAPRYGASFLHQWARRSEERGGHLLRAQIERAAALVPTEQRSRVLGSLFGPRDDHARAVLGVLLLAKTLKDFGWSLEFEPEAAGGTPDFRVAKNNAEFLIEVRRVEAPATSPSQRDLLKIQEALDDIETPTPISVRSASIPGGASMKRFAEYMRELLSGAPGSGPASFNEGGVFIGFDVHKPWPHPVRAHFGCRFQPIFGNQNTEVRNHITEKLTKYKVPLVMALDFFDLYDSFTLVEEVLIGREVMHVPVALTASDERREPYPGRAEDGLLHHGGRDGNRARTRLQGVIAYGLPYGDDGALQFRGRVLENPGAEVLLSLADFAPIPRLAVVGDTNGSRPLAYLDENNEELSPEKLGAWRHVP